MIDAGELRKNNWLQGASISITKFGMFSDGKTQITSYGIYMIDANPEIAKQYSPIPLTPEILESLEFDYDGDKAAPTWFSSEIGFIGKCEGGYTLPDSDGEPSIGYVLKYLHQLQNIFFTLTGKELIYSPIK